MINNYVAIKYDYSTNSFVVKKICAEFVKDAIDRISTEFDKHESNVMILPEYAYNLLVDRIKNGRIFDEVVSLPKSSKKAIIMCPSCKSSKADVLPCVVVGPSKHRCRLCGYEGYWYEFFDSSD